MSKQSKVDYLGEFEQLVISAVMLVGENAYGMVVHEKVDELSGKRKGVSIGAVYTTLDRLEEKGLVKSWLGEATEERGGRAKKYFQVTASGAASLRQTLQRGAMITADLRAAGVQI